MARLCVRIAPNNHPTDPKMDALRTQMGDVVCIQEDDHKFSHAEMNCGQYRIVDVPGVPAEKLAHLMESEHDVDGKMTKRHTKSLDLAKLSGKITEAKIALAVKERK